MPQLKIVKLTDTPTPTRSTSFSAMYDVHAVIPDIGTVHISPGGTAIVGTGLLMQVEEGYCVKLYPRSGLAAKLGITLGNAVGVIDRDYPKEVGVILQNNGTQHVTIEHGERICQLEVAPVIPVEFIEVDELPEIDSERTGGFGHTGK